MIKMNIILKIIFMEMLVSLLAVSCIWLKKKVPYILLPNLSIIVILWMVIGILLGVGIYFGQIRVSNKRQ